MFAYVIPENSHPSYLNCGVLLLAEMCHFLNSAQLCVAVPTKLHQPVTAITPSELMLYMHSFMAEGLCKVSPVIPSPPSSPATLSSAQDRTSVWTQGQRKTWQEPGHCTQDTQIVGAILCKKKNKNK